VFSRGAEEKKEKRGYLTTYIFLRFFEIFTSDFRKYVYGVFGLLMQRNGQKRDKTKSMGKDDRKKVFFSQLHLSVLTIGGALIWAGLLLRTTAWPLHRRRASSRLFDDDGLYCTTNSFAQLVHTAIDIEDLKVLSDRWSWSRGRLGLISCAAMLLWYADLLCIGVSITRLAFRPFATRNTTRYMCY
jgi:hypothetical protein